MCQVASEIDVNPAHETKRCICVPRVARWTHAQGLRKKNDTNLSVQSEKANTEEQERETKYILRRAKTTKSRIGNSHVEQTACGADRLKEGEVSRQCVQANRAREPYEEILMMTG